MRADEFQKRLRRVEVRSRLVSQELMAGQADSIFKGRGIDFVDVREYAPGDDVRRIDWNVSARFRKTYIKRMVEERELTVLLLVDLSASGHFGSNGSTKREVAAELAGAIAFSAIRNNDRVGLILFTSEVERYLPPRKSGRHAQRVIRDLLHHTPANEGTDVAGALRFAARVTHRPALIFLISDLQAEGYQPALRAINQRHEVVALQIRDPREETLPDVGWATITDAESGEIIEIDTADPRVRAAYAQAAGEQQARTREFFQSSRIGRLDINTSADWWRPLRTFLAAQARRRVA